MRYKYWKKLDKFRWEHNTTKDRIVIFYDGDDDNPTYLVDYWFFNTMYSNYLSLGVFTSFKQAYEWAVYELRRTDTEYAYFKKN